MRLTLAALASAAAFGLPTLAHADPCEAPVADFRPGDHFVGQVRYVGDGDSLCVGTGRDPAGWIEVRLADFDAPELDSPAGPAAKAALRAVAAGREVSCYAASGRSGRAVSYDRVIAVCEVSGRGIGDLLRARGAPEGGN